MKKRYNSILESFGHSTEYIENKVPRYIDIMMLDETEQALFINNYKIQLQDMDENISQDVNKLIESYKYGSALIRLISESKFKSLSLDSLVELTEKVNDNIIVENNTIKEDWSLGVTTDQIKKSRIKNMELADKKLFLEVEYKNTRYIIEANTSKALAKRLISKYNLLGEKYSRLILADAYKNKIQLHKSMLGLNESTQELCEAPFEYVGNTAIIDIEVVSNDVIKVHYIDKKSIEQNAVLKLDKQKLEADEETAEGLVEYAKDIIEAMYQEDNFTKAVEKSKEIYSELTKYATGGFSKRSSTKKVNDFYSMDFTAQKNTAQVVPVDIDLKVVQEKEEAAELIKTGDAIRVDNENVYNYNLLLSVAVEDGTVRRINLELKDKLKSFWSLEDWYAALLEELPAIPTDGSVTFQQAVEKGKDFMEQIVRDATLGDVKVFTDWFKVKWKTEESGTFQTTDVPEKVDQGELEKPKLKTYESIDISKNIIELISTGFEPNEQGFLKRYNKYLVKECDQIILKSESELWDRKGNPIKEDIDIVHIND